MTNDDPRLALYEDVLHFCDKLFQELALESDTHIVQLALAGISRIRAALDRDTPPTGSTKSAT
jgi:hypothetical protein